MIPSETSREMMRAVARSHSADNAMKSPKEDIRSAPVICDKGKKYKERVNERKRTTSTRVGTSKWRECLLEIVDTVHFLFSFVKVETNGNPCGRYMFERRSSGEVEGIVELPDECVRV